jgi:hypothetical protein
MEPPPRLPWKQSKQNVLLHHGKCLCNNQIASLAQFIDTQNIILYFVDTCCYKENKYPILFLQLVYYVILLMQDKFIQNHKTLKFYICLNLLALS